MTIASHQVMMDKLMKSLCAKPQTERNLSSKSMPKEKKASKSKMGIKKGELLSEQMMDITATQSSLLATGIPC